MNPGRRASRAALLAARSGARAELFILAIGLDGAVALLAAFGAALLAAALDSARPPGWGSLREEPNRDRAVAAGILAGLVGVVVVAAVAGAGQRLFVGKMQSQQARNHRRRRAWSHRGAARRARRDCRAAHCCAIAHALPRPRALGATGVLRLRWRSAAALTLRRGAVARRLARARPRAAVRAHRRASCSASAHGLFWFGRRRPRPARPPPGTARGLRCHSPSGRGDVCLPDDGGAMRAGAPAFTAAADSSWGMRLLLGAARRATDFDGDGFSARFGGGDCDDRRGDVYPAPRMSRATASTRTAKAATRRHPPRRRGAAPARPRPRRSPPSHPRRTASRATCSSSPSTPCAPIAWARRIRPPGRQVADADARRAGAQGRVFPARLVAGAQHAEVVPRDPDRHATRRTSRGTSRARTIPTCCPPTTRTSRRWRPRAGSRSASSRTSTSRRTGASAAASPNGRTTAPGRCRVEQGHRVAAHRPERDRAAAPDGGAQGTLRAVDAPVRAALVVHDAQGIPDVASGVQGLKEKYDYEIAFCDTWVKKLIDAVARARPRRQHGDRGDGRSRRGVGRAQGLLPRPGSVRRAAARAADLRGARAPRRRCIESR